MRHILRVLVLFTKPFPDLRRRMIWKWAEAEDIARERHEYRRWS